MKPATLEFRPENTPEGLQGLNRWICWAWERRGGKWTKTPLRVGGGRASSTAPETWSPFSEAAVYATARELPGVGFVFSQEDDFAGVDLDGCRDPETGEVEPWAREIAESLASYAELSPSGTGLKVFVRGCLPPGRRRKGNVEMYDEARFFTLTGHRLPGSPATVNDARDALIALHERLFPEPEPRRHGRPWPPVGGTLEDHEALERAISAANGEKFAKLWRGDRDGYTSGSEADLALCSLIAFWVGPDEERIARLFSQSGLVREKWSREDYRRRTIAAALSRSEFYHPRRPSRSKARRVWRPAR